MKISTYVVGFIVSALILLSVIMGSMRIVQLSNMLNSQDSLCNSMIGKKIFLDIDSVTIVDHSILNSTFTLSNGKEVSDILIIKK